MTVSCVFCAKLTRPSRLRLALWSEEEAGRWLIRGGDMHYALRISHHIDAFNRWLGRATSWAILAVVIVSSLNAIVRYAFNTDRKSTRLNSSHIPLSRMPSSA